MLQVRLDAASLLPRRATTLRRLIQEKGQHTHRWWGLDEVCVRINGVQHDLWRAVDREGEVLESFATQARDKAAALRLMKKLMKRHGCAETITVDGLCSYKAAMKEIGVADRQEVGRWANNRRRTHTSRSDDESGRCCTSGG